MASRRSRAEGCLVGLACGDALGRPVEFRDRSRLQKEGPVTEMRGHGTHGKPAGTVTDDTDLALCIARSLASEGGFDGEDVATRFVEWYESGPFDVGLMTADAIRAFDSGTSWERAGVAVWEERPEGSNAGNGSVMRCAPHAIAYDRDGELRSYVSRRSSAITHADPRCTFGCALLNDVLAACVHGNPPELSDVVRHLDPNPGSPEELEAAAAELPDLSRSDLSNSGYVLDTVQAGLYDGLAADTAEDAVVSAVSRGGDADTVGAVAGAIAGARFGIEALPERWVDAVDVADELRSLAGELLALDHDDTRSADRQVIADPDVDGPRYLPATLPSDAEMGHRPDLAPGRVLAAPVREFTVHDAVEADWIRRAYRTTRSKAEAGPGREADWPPGLDPREPGWFVRLPEYARADEFADLPRRDRDRVRAEVRRGRRALDAAEDSFEAVADAVATTPQVHAADQISDLVRVGIHGASTANPGTDPEDVTDRPGRLAELVDETRDLATWASELHQLLAGLDRTEAVADATERARRALGDAQAARDAMRAAAIRHPGVEV